VKLRILSLGAGVQSSTLALMIQRGEIPMVDAAIFADVQAESADTYKFFDWLKTKLTYPVYTVSKGNLTEQLLGSNFPKAPFFLKNKTTGKKGLLRRQCTSDYKIQPIIQEIRRLLGLKKRERYKKGTIVEQLMGISIDEMMRMKPNRMPYITNVYPLVDLKLSRQDCKNWIKKYYNIEAPRSACTYCPFHHDSDFILMKKNSPEEWNEVVEFDKKIRNKNRDGNVENFVHKSCQPIDQVNFNKKDNQPSLFINGCEEGYCGN
jgi:hypothetical protein